MPTKRIVASLLMASSLLGCSIEGSIRHLNQKGQIDFALTEMIAGPAAPADGTSSVIVAVHLKNSDNSVVPSYRPEMQAASGLGLSIQACTLSDQNGISACILKATIPGTKRVRLTNARTGLETDVTFLSPQAGGRLLGLIPGSRMDATTPEGSKLEMSVGDTTQGISTTTNGGYKIKFSVQGAVSSR
ncbi:MAG: hypothetical protein NDI61_09450 [Bdellovibrionaceae bacterium]|nr:hypothetical protein [Pseudobdellovibrionaceae bacterium]